MKLSEITAAVRAKEDEISSNAPDTCKKCPNLDLRRNLDGKLDLVCGLAASDTDLNTSERSVRSVRARAGWLKHVLSINPDNPTRLISGTDSKVLDFINSLEAANEQCPLIDQLIDQLPGASVSMIVELTLPDPVVAA